MILSFSLSAAPTEPLLCKFADGGQKKRQSQSKYPQNGRPWHREGEVRCYASVYLSHPQLEKKSSTGFWCSTINEIVNHIKISSANAELFAYTSFSFAGDLNYTFISLRS